MHPTYTALWLGLAALLVAVEAAALGTRKAGRTLSSHVWALRGLALYGGCALWAWMTWHFWFDAPATRNGLGSLGWDDAGAALLGGLLAAWRSRRLR